MSTPGAGVEIGPLEAAAERLRGKVPVAAIARTREWDDVAAGLLDRAFFSAGVAKAQILDEMQARLQAALEMAKPDGTTMDRSRFVAEMRSLLGAAAGDSGRLTDLTSFRRMELIWDMQTREAFGYGRWRRDLEDGDLLDAFPAQELVRSAARKVPRDWWERWGEAGAAVGWEGASQRRMAALKTSPIWERLSRFGRAWPPFDFGSGMGLRDLDRDEAEALGLIQPGERLDGAAKVADFNEGLEASVRGIRPELREHLEMMFGDQVAIAGDRAVWHRQQPYTDWKAQGLPSARTWQVTEPMPDPIDPAAGRAQMQRGVTAIDPEGREVRFGRGTLEHWAGYADEAKRPAYLPAALRAVAQPQERWTQATQDAWVTVFAKPKGGYRGVVVFAKPGGEAITYFVRSAAALDAARKGVAVWRAGGQP